MALINCPECDVRTSKAAKACPNCGRPIKKSRGCSDFLGLLFFGFIGAALIFYLLIKSVTPSSDIAPIPKPSFNDTKVFYRYAHQAVNIRSGPGKDFEVIGEIDRGERVENLIHEQDGDWLKVKKGSVVGYAFEELLKHTELPPIEISTWNWRSDPSFGGRGALIFTIELQNNTDQYFRSVLVKYTVYDKDKNIVSAESSYITDLAPFGKSSGTAYGRYYGNEHTVNAKIEPPLKLRLKR